MCKPRRRNILLIEDVNGKENAETGMFHDDLSRGLCKFEYLSLLSNFVWGSSYFFYLFIVYSMMSVSENLLVYNVEWLDD
jgi:hypothetical protein